MDRLRDALLTPDEVRRGLERAGVQLDDASFGRVYSLMDPTGAGAVDHAAFTRVLFPPDMHPDAKAFPFERGEAPTPRALGTRRRSVTVPSAAAAAATSGAQQQYDSDAAPTSGGDVPAAGAPSHRSGSVSAAAGGGPSWLDLPTVDQAGLYSTARDASVHAETAHARRHFNLERPAPHLHGSLQPRDAWGTPAPYLLPDAVAAAARRGSGTAETAAVLEQALSSSAASSSAGATVATARRANALLRSVVDKLRAKGEAADVWMKLNHAHDGKVAVKDLREGLARCVAVIQGSRGGGCSSHALLPLVCSMGVHMSADEFKLFGDRVDINRHERIAFGEFARVLKGASSGCCYLWRSGWSATLSRTPACVPPGDDPIPDSFFYKAATYAGQPIAGSSLLAPGAPADALPGAAFGESPGLSRDPRSNPVVQELHYRKHRYAGPDPTDERDVLARTRQQAHDSSAVADSLVQDDSQLPASAGLASSQRRESSGATPKRSLSSPPGGRRVQPRTPSAAIVAASAAESHLATDVSDRLYRRFAASTGGGARDIFMRLASAAGDAAARVPSDPADLRACLSAVGVEASQRQVEAFLRPAIGGPPLDFASFAALVQPRGYVDGGSGTAAPATFVPADFVRKTNATRVAPASPEGGAAPPPTPTPGSVADSLAPAKARVPWATPAEAAAGVAAGTRLRAKSASGTARRPTQQERSATGDAVRGLLEAPVPPLESSTPRGGPSSSSARTPRFAANPVLGDADANPFTSTYRIASAIATQPPPPEPTLRGLGSLLVPSSPVRSRPPAVPTTPAGIPSVRDPRSIQQQSRYVNLPPDAWVAAPQASPAAGGGARVTLDRFGSEATTIDAPAAVAASVPRSEKRRQPDGLGRTFSSSIFSDPQYPSNLVAGPPDEPRLDGYATRPLPRGRARSVEPGFSSSRKRLIPGVEEARGVITDVRPAARVPPPPLPAGDESSRRGFIPGYTGFRSASRGGGGGRSASVDAVLRRPATVASLVSGGEGAGAGVSTGRQPSTVAVSSDSGARTEKKHYRTVQVRSDGVWDALAPA